MLALVLALAAGAGVFESLDGALYDFFIRNSPASQPVTRQVMLVESPASSLTDPATRWDVLADDLLALGATQVVFAARPEAGNKVMEALLKNPRVVVGGHMQPGAERAVPSALEPHSNAVSAISDPLHGVHRYQQYAYRVADKQVASIEALAAYRLGVDIPHDGRYLIDFRGSSSGIPRMKLSQVLDGALIEEVVRSRAVLIGAASGRFHRTLATPVTESGHGATELEYHAYALDSLLRGTAITTPSPAAKALLLIGVWLACFLILQPMPFRKAVLTASLIASGLALFAWLLLFAEIHLPIFGAILVIGSSVVSIFHSKTEYQNQALARLVTETNLAASGRLTGQNVPGDTAFWSHVLAMVDQILPLTRVVLLERMMGTSRVQEVRSLRCSIDSVEERRRDFGRAPYANLIEKGEAIEVRNYLKDSQVGEHQFLAPLIWSGKVLGVLAFGIHQSQMANRATLMRAVDVLSKRLSELMSERSQSMVPAPAAANWRELLIDKRDLAIQTLTQHLNMVDRHVTVLEDMFNGLEAPTMVYDLFGRPLISNARMKSLLEQAEVHAEAQSAADLLETVCSLSPDEARAALVGVVFDGDSFERVARVGSTRYLLHVSRLRNSVNGAGSARITTGEDVLRHIHGLMIQLFPVTNLEARDREHSERVLHDADAPRADDPDHDVRDDGDDREDEREVDVLHAIEAAIASTASSSEHEALSFAVRGPADARAFAHPKKLKDVLVALIGFLAEDTKQAGKLSITVNTHGEHLFLDMQNNGFGMPDEKLQAILEGPGLPKSDCLRRIRQLRNSAFGERGQLALRSAIGGGYVAKATMRLAS